MDEYHRIEVKNISIINVCFRKIGALFNSGRIVLDIDTYDFAGHLSDDVILGFYRDGKYFVYYYYNTYNFMQNPSSGKIADLEYERAEYEIELVAKFKRCGLPGDFLNMMLKFSDEFCLTFDGFVEDTEEINNVLQNNRDLLKPRS